MPGNEYYKPMYTMMDEFKLHIKADNFVAVSIEGKEDIWPAFKKLLTIAERE